MSTVTSTMKSRKNRHRWFCIALLVLVAICAANHVEYSQRSKSLRKQREGTGSVIVRSDGAALGHRSIGIDER